MMFWSAIVATYFADSDALDDDLLCEHCATAADYAAAHRNSERTY